MKERLGNYKKIQSIVDFKCFSPEDLPPPPPPPESERKKHFFRTNGWRLNKRAKYAIVLAAIAVILISTFAFIPKDAPKLQATDDPTASPSITPSPTPSPTPQKTNKNQASNTLPPTRGIVVGTPIPTPPHPPGLIESNPNVNSTVWREVAAYAWAYFQPNVGVDNVTGLPYAGAGFPGFTDWDLGGYIQAVIDAQQMGLVNTTGDWGSYARLNKTLAFLETRQLNNDSYPFQFYYSNNTVDFADSTSETVDITDSGRLLVALNNLITYSKENNFNWTQRIDNYVYNVNGNRSDYKALVPIIQMNMAFSNDSYSYYADSGFGSFFPQVSNAATSIMNNILNSTTLTTYNVTLPQTPINCDPLLCSIFELNNNDSRLSALVNQVYLASEARYNATGQFVAFSEGGSNTNGYLYEWVVGPNGQPWAITNGTQTSYVDMDPVIYTKVAFGFLALYNTTYARNMLTYLEKAFLDPNYGYFEGDDSTGNIVSPGSNSNSLILDAALYSLQRNP